MASPVEMANGPNSYVIKDITKVELTKETLIDNIDFQTKSSGFHNYSLVR